MLNTSNTSSNAQTKRSLYKRSRVQSADSATTADSSKERMTVDGSTNSLKKGVSCLKVDVAEANSKYENHSSYDMSESPYLSALNLPMIVEEDMESENGKTFKWKKNVFMTLESDESPFCKVIENADTKFEDRCENSDLMNSLWSKITSPNQ